MVNLKKSEIVLSPFSLIMGNNFTSGTKVCWAFSTSISLAVRTKTKVAGLRVKGQYVVSNSGDTPHLIMRCLPSSRFVMHFKFYN